MPISNNFIKNTSVIDTIDLSGFSGISTSYRYCKEGFYKLNPNEPITIIPPTLSKVNREITIDYKEELNQNTSKVNLYFGVKNQHPKSIEPGGIYLDRFDGGIALVAECSEPCILEVTIRQDTEIDYLIGNYFLGGDEEMPVELVVRPLITTGQDFSMPPIPLSSVGEGNVRRLIDSNGGMTTGGKVWAIDSFQPGKELNFKIVFESGTIGTNRKIIINLTPIEVIMKAILAMEAGNNSELDESSVDPSLIGWVKLKSYYKEIEAVSQSIFTLKPSHTRYILSFDCENPSTPGYTDTVISSYLKNNIDPYEGGAFTFLGF